LEYRNDPYSVLFFFSISFPSGIQPEGCHIRIRIPFHPDSSFILFLLRSIQLGQYK
jgi:hypothetical protein